MVELRSEWDAAYVNDLPDSAFAYIEPGGDKDEGGKTVPRSLRHFPHHDASGKVDEAHVRNALARIPQSSVSASAKAQATTHVRKHADALDIGQDALPETYETRDFVDYELREVVEDPGEPQGGAPGAMADYSKGGAMPKIVGTVARFGVLSEDLGGFRERISREAFRKTLQEGDCRALWNHDSRLLLGRTSNGTLKLRETRDGLAAEINPPDTSYARDLGALIKRGDLSGMSFGFRALRDDWEQVGADSVRTLKEIQLLDVSPVTFPAYAQTDVAMRSLRIFLGRAARPGQEAHPAVAAAADARAGALVSLHRRRMRLVEQSIV